ncbi:MAG: hypothetical protein K1X50_14170 [Candidatus Promineofilum sp.]|nr:hypothetical protein [Promineifilum sp.]
MTQDATETAFDRLPSHKRRAVEVLLATGRVGQAAEAVKVSRSTIARWQREPDFAQALREQETEAVGNLNRSLIALADKSIDALVSVFDAGTLSQKLRAADIVLGRLLAWRELTELEARITALESRTP